MKKISIIISIAIFSIGFLSLNSCSKDEGLGGMAKVSGNVTYPGGAASGAIVKITYGTKDATSNFDHATVADESGNYKLDGLEKGDYFIDAEYTDQYGNNFNTPGYAITIGDKKADLKVDIELQ